MYTSLVSLLARCTQTLTRNSQISLHNKLNLQKVSLRSASIHLSGADYNSTVEETLGIWYGKFNKANIAEPLESIVNILAHNLKTKNIADVYKNRKTILSDFQLENIKSMCEKRLESMPVQYIIGEWDFRELTLKLRPPVFIPRPETEMLVELVLSEIKERKTVDILELCCGSGAISLALLNQIPQLRATAIDKSNAACRLAVENSKKLKLDARLEVQQCNVDQFVSKKKYDVIVSNPPYVPSNEVRGLQQEILRYEDLEALDGGADGLNVAKQIFAVSSAFLNPGGKLFIEVDPSHPGLINTLLLGNGNLRLRLEAVHKDLAGETRFVEIIKT